MANKRQIDLFNRNNRHKTRYAAATFPVRKTKPEVSATAISGVAEVKAIKKIEVVDNPEGDSITVGQTVYRVDHEVNEEGEGVAVVTTQHNIQSMSLTLDGLSVINKEAKPKKNKGGRPRVKPIKPAEEASNDSEFEPLE